MDNQAEEKLSLEDSIQTIQEIIEMRINVLRATADIDCIEFSNKISDAWDICIEKIKEKETAIELIDDYEKDLRHDYENFYHWEQIMERLEGIKKELRL